MNITKITYKDDNNAKAITLCDVVVEDTLKLVGIRLYKNSNGYFLVFPSKQDVYQDIEQMNEGKDIAIPQSEVSDKKKEYEEFFYPMNSAFYGRILDAVVEGYQVSNKSGKHVYIPRNGGI